MSDAYTKEIPSSRVQITLDLDTHGSKEKKELPLRLLVLNKFFSTQQHLPLNERMPVMLSKNTLAQTMQKLQPSCSFRADNHASSETDKKTIPIDLSFTSMSDFRPEEIVQKVPELRRLLAIKNILTDFKSRLINDPPLRAAFNQKKHLLGPHNGTPTQS